MSQTQPPHPVTPAPEPACYRTHLDAWQAACDPRRLKEGYDVWYAAALPEDRAARILDFGCGRGDFLAYLRLLGYREAEGVDVIPGYAEEITRRTGAAVHVVDDASAFLRDRPACYDLVVVKDVLEHLPHEAMIPFLKDVRHALKPSGRIVVSGPHAASPTGLYTRYLDFTHTTCFTVPSLTYAFECAGFPAPRSVPPRVPFSLRPGRLALSLARRVWFAVLRAIYTVEMPGDPARPPHFYNRLVVWADRRE